MPVLKKNFSDGGVEAKSLFEDLVSELKSPRASGQPLIEIRQMKRDGLKHVHVIWDRWAGVAPETRAAVIRDAFSSVEGESFEQTIAITMAATTPEAVEAGLLPYRVRPFKFERGTANDHAAIRGAMIKEGATDEGAANMPLLCFASEEEASAAVHRLRTEVPNVEWTIVVTQTGAN